MAVAYSKAAKRKAKKAKQPSVEALYREFERDAARAPQEPQEDPLKAPMRARANRLGVKPCPDVLAPHLETEAGRALHVAVGDAETRRQLLQVFMDYDRAVTIYSRRVLGRQRFPAVSKMEFMPERLETSAEDEPRDLRTEDERADSARKAMAEWDGRLDKLATWQARIIRSVSYQQETLVDCGALTAAGRSFVAAVKALHGLT